MSSRVQRSAFVVCMHGKNVCMITHSRYRKSGRVRPKFIYVNLDPRLSSFAPSVYERSGVRFSKDPKTSRVRERTRKAPQKYFGWDQFLFLWNRAWFIQVGLGSKTAPESGVQHQVGHNPPVCSIYYRARSLLQGLSRIQTRIILGLETWDNSGPEKRCYFNFFRARLFSKVAESGLVWARLT